MSSELTILRHQSTPPPPASSPTSSLDDQVNNPEARVYFGPIQSPEKVLIAEAAHSWNNPSSLPVCISPRISNPLYSHKLLSLEEDENAVRDILEVGTTGTPTLVTTVFDEDCLQDGENISLFGVLAPLILFQTSSRSLLLHWQLRYLGHTTTLHPHLRCSHLSKITTTYLFFPFQSTISLLPLALAWRFQTNCHAEYQCTLRRQLPTNPVVPLIECRPPLRLPIAL
jgi:hypothetical protein